MHQSRQTEAVHYNLNFLPRHLCNSQLFSQPSIHQNDHGMLTDEFGFQSIAIAGHRDVVVQLGEFGANDLCPVVSKVVFGQVKN